MSWKKASFLFLALILAVSFISVSCQRPEVKDPEAVQEDTQDMLKIDNEGEMIVVSPESLEDMEIVEKELSITPKEDNPVTERKVKGYYLEDVFKKLLGIDMKSLEAIRLVAGDGYSIEVTNDILKNSEVIIAYEVDGEPLEDWEKPFRSAVSDVFEMYWVKNLILIEVVSKRVRSETASIVFLETRVSQLESEDYEYYESTDLAVKVDDLIIDLEDYNVSDYVYIMASDGLDKNEEVNIFRSGYIKHTGENSPAFLGEDIPKGMWVKKLYYFLYGDTNYYSLKTGLDVLDAKDFQGEESISLQEILDSSGIVSKDSYTLEGSDGYEVEIGKDIIPDGYVFIDENNNVSIVFEGGDKKYSVKDLLMIK